MPDASSAGPGGQPPPAGGAGHGDHGPPAGGAGHGDDRPPAGGAGHGDDRPPAGGAADPSDARTRLVADRPVRPRVVAGLRLLRLVGSGGEGEVWEARTSHGEARALKLIRPDALVEPDEVERRGRWLRAVDHPALVAVRRTGVLAGGGLDGWGFVEMPFLDGPSLDRAPPDPDVLDRLAPLAEALDALHAGTWSDGVPLVHRDVKPANLIDVGDHLVLVDHSTLRDASAETVTRIGTPVFAAPEVPLGRAGPPADVYAFAATAVALLTGARGGALATLLAHPDALEVPGGLRAALADDPRDRPRTCSAALEAQPTIALEPPGGADPAGDDTPPWGTQALPPPPGAWEAQAATADTRALGAHDAQTQAVWDAETRGAASLEDTHAWVDDRPAAHPDTRVWADDHPWAAEHMATDVAEEPRAVWRWVGVLALIALAPPLALTADRPLWPDVVLTTAAAAALHLVAQVVAGGPPIMRLLAPPLAWAWLLARRAARQPRRRAYARAVCAGGLSAGAVAAAWALAAGAYPRVPTLLPAGPLEPLVAATGATLPLLAAASGLLLAVGGVVAARRGGFVLQLALLPAWLVGALLLTAGALALSPLAVLVGRGQAALRLAGVTLASALEVFRRPVAPPQPLP